ncbi:MAG: 2-amino-4-hydroxy-6-hydroxymethyldihydropteridine diphosphokinase [Alphaproteobacteria bacterium]|nr:2-amino-4-hydroxy-6-hydroxymethyldihydropteridine diphosphokinase [Alphaproteobacteria bacterium]
MSDPVTVLIALGANQGDPADAIRRGVEAIAALDGVRVTAVSALYASAPMYVEDQPEFINSALLAETALTALDLLRALQAIERRIGRVATYRNGPRVLDLDIIYYGDAIIETEALAAPHPRRLERRFVLAPAAEIAPDFLDPLERRPLAALLAELDSRPDGGGRVTRL